MWRMGVRATWWVRCSASHTELLGAVWGQMLSRLGLLAVAWLSTTLTTVTGPGTKPGLAQASKEYLLAKYPKGKLDQPCTQPCAPLHCGAFQGASPVQCVEALSLCLPCKSVLPGRLSPFDPLPA